MRLGNGATVAEPARNIPLYGTTEVLVVGGGPAGVTAAIAAARAGAEVTLVERYGCLGGLSTGGLVIWIDRMTDWDGRLVVGGIGKEITDACAAANALIGPPPEQWGSKDPKLTAYWGVRTAGHKGTVNFSPTVDPEELKLILNDLVRAAGVHVILHSWAVATLHDGGTVNGAIFESKEGRFAIHANVTIDCTGDGDIFAGAGAAFDNDFDAVSAHARLNTSFRFGNVDMRRYLDFRMIHPDRYNAIMAAARDEDEWMINPAFVTPNDSIALFLTPKFSGYSALQVADLTAVEFRSRDVMRQLLAWYRAHMPGFERAWIHDTASQIGTRHSRRLRGIARIHHDAWRGDGRAADSIGLCPGISPNYPTLEIPYGVLVPERLDGVLAAGRNLSCDTTAHAALREIPECWVVGQAAGVGAALAINRNCAPRAVPVASIQSELRRQGALVARDECASAKR